MLIQVYLITFQSFSFCLISFLIVISTNAALYDWNRINKNSFLDDFNIANWNSVMEIKKNDVNISFNNYLSKLNYLIMSHVPIIKLNKQQQKFLQKPGFTTAMQNSI